MTKIKAGIVDIKQFYTKKVELFNNEFQIFRTTQSGDIWQFRMWNATEQSYIRKTTKQKRQDRAERVATAYYKEIIAGQSVETVNAKKKRVRVRKGNKILEEHELFDGEIRIFRVAQSGKIWQVYIWIREEQKALKKSLRTKYIDLARDRAKEIYFDYQTKLRTGEAIFDKKAKELTKAFIDKQIERCDNGIIKQQFVATLKTRMKHYLKFVGENSSLANIVMNTFEGYLGYRKEIAPNVKLMTLYNERGTIKALYKFAIQNKFLHAGYEPYFGEWKQIKKSGEKINRDALDRSEWNKIYMCMNNWHTKKHVKTDKQSEQRRFIREFSLILCNSGIRFGEARRLQWHDIELYDELVGKEKKVRCKIHLPASKTKTGTERIAISRTGLAFKRLKKLSNFTKGDDLIFVDNDTGMELAKKVYYKEWKEMLNMTGLDEGHKNIVYYCLRHTYATFQLYKGVDVFSLSKVMGCGVDFIQNHYGHIDIEKMRDKFTRDFKRSESGEILFG